MEELRSMLQSLSKEACRLLLLGAVTLAAALGLGVAAAPCPEYVDAILAEAEHMPDDLRAQFVAGAVTIADARAEILRRHVRAALLTPEEADLFLANAIDLGTIDASVAREFLLA